MPTSTTFARLAVRWRDARRHVCLGRVPPGDAKHAHLTLRRLVQGDDVLHTTDVVIMEVLAGARDDTHADRLRRLLGRCEFVATGGLDDFERAAAICRQRRRAGGTIRALTDCLIAGVAIRVDLDLLHADRDFEALARHTELRLYAGVLES